VRGAGGAGGAGGLSVKVPNIYISKKAHSLRDEWKKDARSFELEESKRRLVCLSHSSNSSTLPSSFPYLPNTLSRLEGEEQQEGHHKTEEPHGLGEGEAENGVGEELLFERRIPGVADDERTEDGTDTGAGTGNAHRRSARADVLGRRIDVQNAGRRLEGSGRVAERGCQASVAGEQSRSRRRRHGSSGRAA